MSERTAAFIASRGPHKIWIANSKLNEAIVPVGAYYQKHSSLSKAEIEIITNVINARWLAAYSNYEHEIITEEQGEVVIPPLGVEILARPDNWCDAGHLRRARRPRTHR